MNERSATGRALGRERARARRRPRIGLALAGGGPLGAIYEIGALAALSEALHGIDFSDVDVYVGVSAGGFIAAGLVNGFTPQQMSALFIDGVDAHERFDPGLVLRPAIAEYGRRLMALPPAAARALWHALRQPANVMGALERLGRAIPTGLFSGAQIDRYLARTFNQPGRTNDFRSLRHPLFLVATDLDTGEPIAFGSPGTEHVPISLAVQATTALPGLFPPVQIDGRHYVDGALRKTLHASVALDQGVELLICLNPLVPYDARLAHPAGQCATTLAEAGLPVVLAQTFRAIIHSRLDAGMERYRTAYPQADIVLFEPNRADAEMFFTNLFSYSSRRRLCEHAYQKTRAELLARRHELAPRLARHGITIDAEVLHDPSRSLVRSLPRPAALPPGERSLRRLRGALDDLDRYLMHAA